MTLTTLTVERTPLTRGDFARPEETPFLNGFANGKCGLAEVVPDDRKMRLLLRSGLFGEDTKGATIERASTLEDLREAYRLVHDVYLGTGFIQPEPSGLRLRIFESSSDTATFVAKLEGRVVGVLSIVGDSSDLGLPSDAAFKPELDELRRRGVRLCEVTNQAVLEEYRRSAVPTELMRCAITHALKAGFHEGVATVSPSHNGFYDLLGFRPLGSQRSYSHKLHDPVVALSMDIRRHFFPPVKEGETARFLHRFMTERNRFLDRVSVWDKMAKRHFLNPDFLEELFVSQSNFVGACSTEELQILQRRWGQEMFKLVTARILGPASHSLFAAVPPVEPDGGMKPATTPPFASGTANPFLHAAPEVFQGLGGRLLRLALRVRDRITRSLPGRGSSSAAPFEGHSNTASGEVSAISL